MIATRMALSSRDRRALIAGASVIGALVLGGRALPAWRRWQRTAQTSAARAAVDLAQSEAALRAQRAVHDSLTARQRRLAALRLTWLDGDTPAGAGAALAAHVSNAVTRAAMTVGAFDIHADSVGRGDFAPVRVHATVTGDIQGIATLLATLERGPVRLVVRALTIQGTDPAAVPNRTEILHADLTVEAVWRRPSFEREP